MEITLAKVLVFSVIDYFIIAVSGTYFLVTAYKGFIAEMPMRKMLPEDKNGSTFDIYQQNLRALKERLLFSFYILEVGLIMFFIFWGAMFYFNAKIV